MSLYNKGIRTVDRKPSIVAKLTALNPDAVDFFYSALNNRQEVLDDVAKNVK